MRTSPLTHKYNYHLSKKVESLSSKRTPALLSEYRITDPKIFSKNYNINLNEDGSVFDKDLKIQYDTLSDWMKSAKRSIK